MLGSSCLSWSTTRRFDLAVPRVPSSQRQNLTRGQTGLNSLNVVEGTAAAEEDRLESIDASVLAAPNGEQFVVGVARDTVYWKGRDVYRILLIASENLNMGLVLTDEETDMAAEHPAIPASLAPLEHHDVAFLG